MEHKGLEFHVEFPTSARDTKIFYSFDSAAGYAVAVACSTGMDAIVDVVVWSEAGALAWGGSDAVEQYQDDPEASVFERIEIKANSLGRIP